MLLPVKPLLKWEYPFPMTTNSESPLTEADPQSLDALFSMDPLSLTDKDLAVIVRELRKQRERWAAAEAQGKTRAPKAASAPAGAKTKVPASTIKSLADLGL